MQIGACPSHVVDCNPHFLFGNVFSPASHVCDNSVSISKLSLVLHSDDVLCVLVTKIKKEEKQKEILKIDS